MSFNNRSNISLRQQSNLDDTSQIEEMITHKQSELK